MTTHTLTSEGRGLRGWWGGGGGGGEGAGVKLRTYLRTKAPYEAEADVTPEFRTENFCISTNVSKSLTNVS